MNGWFRFHAYSASYVIMLAADAAEPERGRLLYMAKLHWLAAFSNAEAPTRAQVRGLS